VRHCRSAGRRVWRLGIHRQKRREALDEMRRAAGTLEVRQLSVRTSGDNPQGLTPFDAGQGSELFNGCRVYV
jgi:hypothetical protein